MSASRVTSRPFFSAAFLVAAVLGVALAGCDAADPHVPAVVRVPAAAASAFAPSPSSMQAAAAARDGLAPPVMHTVD